MKRTALLMVNKHSKSTKKAFEFRQAHFVFQPFTYYEMSACCCVRCCVLCVLCVVCDVVCVVVCAVVCAGVCAVVSY